MPDGWGAAWSPDGRTIAYTVSNLGRANLTLYDVEKKLARNVLQGEHGERYGSIRWSFGWSPDSKQICLKAEKHDDSVEITVVDTAGSERGLTVLARHNSGNSFSWHPDGQRILYSKWDPMRRLNQLFTLNLAANRSSTFFVGQPIHRANTGAAWSPDGKRVVFASRELERNQ